MADLKKYIMLEDFTSPKVNLQQREMQTYNFFQKGTEVTGEEVIDEPNNLQLLIIDDTWAIPLSKVEPSAKQNNSAASDKTTIGEEFQKEFDRIKGTNLVDNVMARSKNSVNGIVIGAGAGLIVAAITKKSMLWCVILGGIAGGLAGNAWKVNVKQMQKANEKK